MFAIFKSQLRHSFYHTPSKSTSDVPTNYSAFSIKADIDCGSRLMKSQLWETRQEQKKDGKSKLRFFFLEILPILQHIFHHSQGSSQVSYRYRLNRSNCSRSKETRITSKKIEWEIFTLRKTPHTRKDGGAVFLIPSPLDKPVTPLGTSELNRTKLLPTATNCSVTATFKLRSAAKTPGRSHHFTAGHPPET